MHLSMQRRQPYSSDSIRTRRFSLLGIWRLRRFLVLSLELIEFHLVEEVAHVLGIGLAAVVALGFFHDPVAHLVEHRVELVVDEFADAEWWPRRTAGCKRA